MTRADMLVGLFRCVNCIFLVSLQVPKNANVFKHTGISLRAVFTRVMKTDEENA